MSDFVALAGLLILGLTGLGSLVLLVRAAERIVARVLIHQENFARTGDPMHLATQKMALEEKRLAFEQELERARAARTELERQAMIQEAQAQRDPYDG